MKVKLKTDDDDHGHKTKVHIVSIQYNGEILTETPFNTMAFQWTVDKQGGIKELRQSMTTGRGKEKTQVDATFNAKNNQTTIDLHNGKQGKVVKPGLNLLRLATNKGSLNIEY